MEWWNFVDWSDTFKDGDPPMEENGQSSILSLQFVAALRAAADLETAFGSAQQAEHDRALASRIAAAVYKTCWDPARHLIADTPARQAVLPACQHPGHPGGCRSARGSSGVDEDGAHATLR